MPNHIAFANLNLLGGLLEGRIDFSSGLNIISGENGTLKTQMLQALRAGMGTWAEIGNAMRMQVFSPKRNSERRAAESIVQHFRQSNRTWENSITERVNAQINTTGFDTYHSLADLYYLFFEYRCKDGADRLKHMAAVASEFNSVIQSVFPNYLLLAEWDRDLGSPRIRMSKNKSVDFPIEALSMGEQEVLSLILSISTNAQSVDCYLIDEPEVHLNWHLEERLFAFLDDFCSENKKQAIVVTHSRTIFKPRFLPKAQFLRWNEAGKVEWSATLTDSQRQRLAGDAIEIVALGTHANLTFFVEDSSHEIILQGIADLYSVKITTSICGNSSNVKSLYTHQLTNGNWPNSYFLIDGDNQGNPYPNSSHFLQLPYYCIENIFLDFEILAAALNRTSIDIQNAILQAMKSKQAALFQKNKF